jgi:two-component system, OmpR family, sensor histidine kinase KdpD
MRLSVARKTSWRRTTLATRNVGCVKSVRSNRKASGCVLGIVVSVALGAVLLPFRSHLSVATTGILLVLPVVGGAAIGGFVAGLLSVGAGFLVFDFAFIPPYYTLTVGNAQNWLVLVVYIVVMLVVSAVVSSLEDVRAESTARARNAEHLFELSERLLASLSLEDLGESIVRDVLETFGLSGVALLLSIEGRLTMVASAGASLGEKEMENLSRHSRVPVSLTTGAAHEVAHTLALSTSGRPVGLLVMQGELSDSTMRELLPTLANQLALALERAQLRERALRAEVLEEIDRLRQALVGAVSHDLRTPLATMKVASTTLLDPDSALGDAETRELYALIDLQTDRLTRLVASLLDMTRLEAGVLDVQRAARRVDDPVKEAMDSLITVLDGRRVDLHLPEHLPEVSVDQLLVGQVLTNLLENADRHAPEGSAITVEADTEGQSVRLSVTDRGPGVPVVDRESVFESFVRFDTGGRAGLGLALAKTFVDAHGGKIWVEDATGGGARFMFTLPVANVDGRR